MKKFNFLQRAMGLFLCLALVASYVPLTAHAAVPVAQSTVADVITDPNTADDWEHMMGTDTDGNRYAGRVWADRSVYKDGDTVVLNSRGEASSSFQVALEEDESFQVVFSVLGSTMTSTETVTTTGPMDVVLVLDTSTSMDDVDSENVTRLERTIVAANKLIDDLLALGDVRIAIVTYNVDSETVLELAEYNNGVDLVVTEYRNNGDSDAGVVTAYDDDGRKLGSDDGYTMGTNLQAGIDRGFNLLANATGVAGRKPAAIVLTDGQAVRASQEGFYEISSHRDRDGTNASGRNLYLSTLLNAAYNKTKIELHYGMDATVYTVGVDVRGNTTAQLLMNPADSTNGFKINSTGWYKDDITLAYEDFQTWASGQTVTNSGWTFDHNYPKLGGAMTAAKIAANINYADSYYDVSNANLGSVFDQIYQELSSGAFNPITSSSSSVGGTGVDDTPLIYADYIGQHMEIKEIQAITLFGASYGVIKNANGTYTVDAATGTNPTTSERWNTAEDILITVIEEADGTQKLEIRINQEILPIIMEQVESETIGKVTTSTITELKQEPLRVYYTIGVDSEILLPNGKVDVSKLQGYPYIDDATGTVSFYANQFGEENPADGSGVVLKGDSHVGFQPSPENRYYYHQKNQGIFTGIVDENGKTVTIPENNEYGIVWNDEYSLNWMTYEEYQAMQPGMMVYTYVTYNHPTPDATDAANAAEEVTYLVYTDWLYLKESVAFYDENAKTYLNDGKAIPEGEVNAAIAAYLQTNPNAELYAVLGVGSRRTSRLHNMMHDKISNDTGTAVESYTPEYLENKQDHHGNDVVIWLGNNGKLTVEVDTGIALTKSVTEPIGNADDTYALTVTVPAGVDADPVVVDENGNTVAFTYSGNVLTVNVKANQTVYISGIPGGTVCAIGENVSGDYYISGKTDTVTVPLVSQALSTGVQFAPATVTNAPNKYGNLFITKAITSDHTVPQSILDTPFEITVNVGSAFAGETFAVEDSSHAQPYDVTVDPSGNMTFQIKARQTVEILSIPAGTAVTVSEANPGSHFAVSYRTRNHSGEAADADNALVIPTNGSATAVVMNHYTPAPVSVELDIAGTKNFTAEGSHAGGTFTYEVQRPNGAAWETIPGKTAQTPYAANEDGTKTFTIDDVLAGITYTEVGSHAYQVIEVIGNADNVTYDRTLYTFTVEVTDNGGQLVATVRDMHNTPITDGSYEVTFNNTWHTAPVSLDVQKIVKNPSGAEISLAGFEFKAVRTDANWNALTGADAAEYTLHSDAAGEARFASVCTQVGTYYFVLTEIDANAPGWTYSGAEYRVTVTVEESNGDLTASLAIAKANSDQAEETATVNAGDATKGTVTFVNTYDPGSTTVDLDGAVSKVLTGKTLEADQFTFYVYNDGDRTTPVLIGTNDLNGDVSFVDFNTALIFETVGTYRYDIVEDIPTNAVYDPATGKYVLDGMYYDPTIYDLVVEVENDAATGALTTSCYFEDAVGNVVTFRNEYRTAPTAYTLGGVKLLHGRAPRAGEFTFELYEGNVLLQTVSNKADGSFTFESIPYTAAGDYTYTIRELDGDAPGVSYDGVNAPVTVTVSVTDTNGVLSAVADIANANIRFENSYDPANATVVFNGTKVLEGGSLTDGAFTFQLIQTDHTFDITSSAAQLLGTAMNEDGGFEFARELDAAGTYYYVVVEDASVPTEGIVYDRTHHAFTVQVSDIGDGQLKATVTSAATGETDGEDILVSADVVFTNATFESVTQKEVFAEDSATFIDGQEVSAGDILTYRITYINYTGADVVAEIMDVIPAHTAYVEGSASHGGSYVANHLSWILNVPKGESAEVSFQVVVEEIETETTIYNIATVRDGVNIYHTNEAINPVDVPEPTEPPTEPTVPPTEAPTAPPTEEPTAPPTEAPTAPPTEEPTAPPTDAPTQPTEPSEPDAPPVVPDLPKTGDSMNLHMWFAVLFVCSGGMIISFVLGKKEKKPFKK